jgi:hypothetical protein
MSNTCPLASADASSVSAGAHQKSQGAVVKSDMGLKNKSCQQRQSPQLAMPELRKRKHVDTSRQGTGLSMRRLR